LSANDLLRSLRQQTFAGDSVRVVDSFLQGRVRLVCCARADGIVTGWLIEDSKRQTPCFFRTEQDARQYIRTRYSLEPYTKRWGD